MIWEHIKDASKRVARARRKLFEDRNAQFWGTIGLTMPMVASDEIETMATDSRSIYYSPAYVMALTESECMGVIAHEISHVALRHFPRMGDRDQNTWNMAADYELNLDLVKAGFTLPDGLLLDTRFDGLSAEQVYNVISRENEQDKKQGNTPRHTPQSGNMIEPSNDDGSPMSGEQLGELNERIEQTVSQALGAARKAGLMAGGHIPTSLVAISATRSMHNVIDWRQPLRAFIDVLGSRQSSWAKLSRRGLTRGHVLPGQKVIRPSIVAFMIDVSGSMDSAKVRQALVEAQSALDDGACDAIDVIYTDTAVKAIDHYEAGETIQFHDGTGGGTNFRAVMQHVIDSDDNYAAIVFLTDGQTTSFGDDPEIPVLWAITDTLPATERLRPPFGEKLCLYTS
jgi:predicted metal-dependent peptidase